MDFKMKKVDTGTAWLNVRRRKKAAGAGILLFLSLLLFMGVNSGLESMNQSIYNTLETPLGRTIIIDDDKEHSEGKKLREQYKDNEDILAVYTYTNIQWGTWNCAEFNMEAGVCSYNPGLSQYIKSGGEIKTIGEGEIVIPYYLYGYGGKGKSEYICGDTFLGKTITIQMKNSNNEKVKNLELKVTGTYDNIAAVTGNDEIYVSDNLAVELSEFMMEDYNGGVTEVVEHEDGTVEENYTEITVPYFSAICFKNRKTAEKYMKQYDALYCLYIDESLVQYYDYLMLLGNILAIFLMLAAFVQLILSIINELDNRKKELALMQAMGYERHRIIYMIAAEYAIQTLIAFLLAITISEFGIQYGNYVIQHYLSMAEHGKHLTLMIDKVCIALFMSVILPVVSGIIVYKNIIKMQLVSALKQGD